MHVSVINELTESNNNVHTIRTRGPVRGVNDATASSEFDYDGPARLRGEHARSVNGPSESVL